ncbi:MAG: ATP synthase F1 subunit delta [Paramuribaculum sp.]|nr:ATP synthase F1 subunit delta [Paramuribaculum sp.]
MNQGLIPRRYAKALYAVALEKGKAKEIYNLMSCLVTSFEDNSDLQQALANPFVPEADKMTLVRTAAGVKTGDDSVFDDFLCLLVRNRRIDFTRGIALAYLDIYREANRIYVVKVESASPLSEENTERLKALVGRHLGDAHMEFSTSVNPSLIGGFTVTVGNERLDASISNELKQLRLNLLSK